MTRGEAEQFLYAEARLLDQNRLREWLDLTSADFLYWVPVNAADVDPDRHLSVIYDTRTMCEERVFRVAESGMNHPHDPPATTMRSVSNVEVVSATADEAVVHCTTLIFEAKAARARRDNRGTVAHPARSEYRLRREQDRWLMTLKKTLLEHDGPLASMTFA